MNKNGITVGIEVHVQLQSCTKMFCSCPNSYGDPPNTNICPVCMGLPGALPTINANATRMGIMLALALSCNVNRFVPYHRKNYFYPDLPKGYQITQFYTPLGQDGSLNVYVNEQPKDILIERIHLEEDSGKMFHDGNITSSAHSLVDYNRCGAPLAEIVTKPCMKSSEEVWAYLVGLRNLVRYLGVSSGNMDEGALRCDLNISVDKPDGSLGTKVEIKNLNSFRSARRAIEFEEKRQRDMIGSGAVIETQTMHFNESTGETIAMRSKEMLNDYRYFPEPDLPPLRISENELESIREEMPEIPSAKVDRFVKEYDLSLYDALVLTADKETARFFEQATSHGGNPKKICNWLTVEIAGRLSKRNLSLEKSKMTPENLSTLVHLIDEGTITGKAGKDILDEVIDGADPIKIAERRGLIAIVDEEAIREMIKLVIKKNPNQFNQYKEGKKQLFGFFVGAVVKESKGKAPGNLISKLLKQELDRD